MLVALCGGWMFCRFRFQWFAIRRHDFSVAQTMRPLLFAFVRFTVCVWLRRLSQSQVATTFMIVHSIDIWDSNEFSVSFSLKFQRKYHTREWADVLFLVVVEFSVSFSMKFQRKYHIRVSTQLYLIYRSVPKSSVVWSHFKDFDEFVFKKIVKEIHLTICFTIVSSVFPFKSEKTKSSSEIRRSKEEIWFFFRPNSHFIPI